MKFSSFIHMQQRFPRQPFSFSLVFKNQWAFRVFISFLKDCISRHFGFKIGSLFFSRTSMISVSYLWRPSLLYADGMSV